MRLHRSQSIRRLLVWGFLAIGAAPMIGCFNPFSPQELTGGVSISPPTPDTPSSTLRLLEWCYNNRAIAEYRELFTDDYRFQFGALDPYGNAYRNDPWTREDELASATNLFRGGTEKQAATSITLSLDRNFRVSSDPRYPDSLSRVHKTIRTNVQFSILDADQVRTDVSGSSLFFLVRGDAAEIPQELIDRGFGPDSTRWYIERWEDESAITPGGTAAGSAAATVGRRARPAGVQDWGTLGYIKVLWR